MKLTVLFSFLVIFQVGANNLSIAQKRVSLDLKNVSLEEFFSELRRQTGNVYVFNSDETRTIQGISVLSKDEMETDVLDRVLKSLNLGYKVVEDYIVIFKTKTHDEKQTKTVTVKGKVVDVSKLPIPGVTVQLKGTNIGVVTNTDGLFSIVLTDTLKSELIFTFVGMKTKTLKCVDLPKKGEWVITLEDDVLQMEEVNVVSTGYGDVDRRRLTSAVTSLTMDDIMVPGFNSVDQMLEGHIPGMIFMQNSGQVGATPRVRIRGNSTIIGNQEPLWVVDGIVQSDPVNVDPTQLNDLDFVNLLGNAISGLNPEDIERIDVLKDAAATAIYGTRAANGVIVITTKKGKAGPPTVSYALTGTFSSRPHYTDESVYMMNSQERVEVSREMFSRQLGFENVTVFTGYDKAAIDYNEGRISLEEFRTLANYYETVNTDWFDLLCQNSFSNKHTLSLSGGSDNLRYYGSVGYNNQQGVIKGEENKQLTSALKLNGNFNKMNFQFSMNFNNSEKRYTPNVGGISVVQYAYETSRALPAYNLDGTRAFHQKGETPQEDYVVLNMENEMEKTYQSVDANSFTVSGMVNYRFWDVLQAEVTASYSTSNTSDESVFEEGSFYVLKLRKRDKLSNLCPVGGERNVSATRMNSWLGRFQLNYGQHFGELRQHMLNVSFGGEISSKTYHGESNKQRGYYPDRGKTYGGITDGMLKDYVAYGKWLLTNFPTLTESHTNLGSLFFSATYNYDNRYTLNFNTRVDASNQFGSNSREKLLPIWSVSGRWDIGREFWPEHPNVNELALKLSYGHQGNMISGQTSKMIITKGSLDSYFQEFASTVKSYPNPDLKWETTASYNAELTFSLFKNKVSGSFAYYYKKTTDAFLDKKISTVNGRNEYTVNQGDLENQGVEATFSFMPINRQLSSSGKRGFVWRFDPQIGQVVNKLINKAIQSKENTVRDKVTYKDFLDGTVEIPGEPLNTFYSYRFKGLSHDKGQPIFYGTEMERAEELREKYNKMTSEQVALKVMERSGTRVPVLQGGVSNYFGYRQFGLSFNFTYSLGNKIRMLKICEDYNVRPYPFRNLRREFVDRWRRPGDENKTNIPGLVTSNKAVYEDAWWNTARDVFRFAGMNDNYYTMYDHSDVRVISGDYFKLQSLSFRYNVGDKFCQKIGIKSAYISLSGTNLFTIQDKEAKGMDVTSQSGSASTVSLSIRPTYSFSLNVTF